MTNSDAPSSSSAYSEQIHDGEEHGSKGVINFMETSVVFGKRYPLVIGSSSGESTALTTLQYVFKPSSIDSDKPGRFALSDSNEAIIALPTVGETGPGNETERFKGTATKPSQECVLSFKGDRFEMAKVSTAIVNIRHNRDESVFKAQDETASKAKKFLEKTLLLRAGPKTAPKVKRASKKDVQHDSTDKGSNIGNDADNSIVTAPKRKRGKGISKKNAQHDDCIDTGSNIGNSAGISIINKKQRSLDKIKKIFSIVQHDNDNNDDKEQPTNDINVYPDYDIANNKTIQLPITS
mmetsp:Transcript_36203/g.34239  ORF Transcript_36203/g.34239 Transcript_36203/m.34239 type:complete len:294 (+) Transcript_36203:221-1102(+)|eukprot:CAMPEP_0119053500 /NCGR_PEP_ID=MMETSP1177-20130426/74469_1 /TAXON_ID=2985 /ORGANISM="Ochromonas sp, Strain CCMP1899" /LENGTH=293 /DNA_ID=CAMNT_0007033469 /DNA_START=146 /DNA_END=1027 /DNA_ORIENTATION=-